MIALLLSQITSLLGADFPELKASLNAPATDQQIQAAEQEIGKRWPEELKELYRLHDGQAENGGLFWGLPFLSIQEALDQWRSWKEVAEEGIASLDNSIVSVPTGAIKEAYANSYYVPISYDFGGNHLGIDLDPDTRGTVGQLINFGRDEETRYVIATSLTEFFKFMLIQAQSGNFVIVEEGSSKSWRLKSNNKSHFLDTLEDLDLPVGSPPQPTGGTTDPEDYASWFAKLSPAWQGIVNCELRSGKSGFAALSKLTVLRFIRENISDLSPLEKFPALRELAVSANPIHDITPLKHLAELKKLYLAHTQVKDLQALGPLSNLGELSLAGLTLDDISILKSLKKLKSLGLSSCTLADLEVVSQLKPLTELDVRNCRFPSFDCLQKLKNLKELRLGGTNVADLAFLAPLKKLTTLEIYDLQIKEFSVLGQLPNLSSVTCNYADFLIIKELLLRKIHFAIRGEITETQFKTYKDYQMS